MIESPFFYSKILLFGEYSIILHSMGLAVPYHLFGGRLVLKHITDSSRRIQQSNRELKAFCEYIEYKTQQNQIDVDFDFTSLEFDIAQGLYFQSNIPQGFGVGSSGALTAALYERYVYDKIDRSSILTTDDILKLKLIFGQMESHFHGSSSGVDPLICYLNQPLLIKSKTAIETVKIPEFNGVKYEKEMGAIFLLNTNRPRKTEPLVNLFLEKCKQEDFKTLCTNELMVYNDNCINYFLSGEVQKLLAELKKVSQFQFEHFQPMIPPLYRQIWQYGLESDKYYLKLCGAGGGGFILGFTPHFNSIRSALSDYQLRVVYKL
jgi:mevalonate kinase